jgi:hypothetical protein
MMNVVPSRPSRLWLPVLTVALVNIGCHSKTDPSVTLTTYTITGVVRASADQSPLEAATVQASGTSASGVWVARSAVSDAFGHYVITGLRDSVTVASYKTGFLNTGTICN